LAWARLSSTSGKWAGSISSSSTPSPARLSIARAISSWLSGGNRRTAARAFSRSLVMGASIRHPGGPAEGGFMVRDRAAVVRYFGMTEIIFRFAEKLLDAIRLPDYVGAVPSHYEGRFAIVTNAGR